MAGNYRSRGNNIGKAIAKGVNKVRQTKDMARAYNKNRKDRATDTAVRQERKAKLDKQVASHKAKLKQKIEVMKATAKGVQDRKTKREGAKIRIQTEKQLQKIKEGAKKKPASKVGKFKKETPIGAHNAKKQNPKRKRRVAPQNKI
jgi:hypothetical protein